MARQGRWGGLAGTGPLPLAGTGQRQEHRYYRPAGWPAAPPPGWWPRRPGAAPAPDPRPSRRPAGPAGLPGPSAGRAGGQRSPASARHGTARGTLAHSGRVSLNRAPGGSASAPTAIGTGLDFGGRSALGVGPAPGGGLYAARTPAPGAGESAGHGRKGKLAASRRRR